MEMVQSNKENLEAISPLFKAVLSSFGLPDSQIDKAVDDFVLVQEAMDNYGIDNIPAEKFNDILTVMALMALTSKQLTMSKDMVVNGFRLGYLVALGKIS